MATASPDSDKLRGDTLHWCFIHLQRERISFERTHLLGLAKRLLVENGEQTAGKEKTITKDVAVLLQNYVASDRLKGAEERQNLLTDLHLLNESEREIYQFSLEKRENVPDLILLFALLSAKGEQNLLDFGQIQHVAFVFCMNDLLLRERILAHATSIPSSHFLYRDCRYAPNGILGPMFPPAGTQCLLPS